MDSNDQLTTIPADVTAERATLGSVLLQSARLREVTGWLKPEHFYLEKHASIYEAMLACEHQGTPADTSTVFAELRRRDRLESVGGLPYLIDLANTTPFSAHIEFYGKTVHQTALLRLLMTAGSQITALAFDERDDLDHLLSTAQNKLQAVVQRHIGAAKYTPQPLTLLLQEPEQPVRWAVPDLLPAGLTLLCGKPKMKKSWMALSIGIAIASGGRVLGHIPVEQGEVLYLCLEDGRRRLRSRATKVLMGGGQVDNFYFVTDWPKVDQGGMRMLESWLQQHPNTRLVVIDTLQKVRPDRKGAGSYDDDYKALEDLQKLAVSTDIPFLVVHHLNKRDVTDEADAISGTTGLTGSCDGWLILKRERRANEGTLSINGRDIEEEREIAVRWDGPTCQWITEGDAEAYHMSQQRQDIMTCLLEAGQPLGPKEVSDELEMEHQNTRQMMSRMAREGVLTVEARGRYAVAPPWTVDPDSDNVIDMTQTAHESDSNVINVIRPESPDHIQMSHPESLLEPLDEQCDPCDHIAHTFLPRETCASAITLITLPIASGPEPLNECDPENTREITSITLSHPQPVIAARTNINNLRDMEMAQIKAHERYAGQQLRRLSFDDLRRLHVQLDKGI